MGKKDLSFQLEEERFSCRAAALIIRGGRILLAKNRDLACYYTVGGGIKEGESSEEAVKRELFEELGLRLEPERLAFIQERFCTIGRQKYHEICFFYLIRDCAALDAVRDGGPTDQGGQETVHWVPLSGLSDYEIVPAFLKDRLPQLGGSPEHIIVFE